MSVYFQANKSRRNWALHIHEFLMTSFHVALLEADSHWKNTILWYFGSLRPFLLPLRMMTLMKTVGDLTSSYRSNCGLSRAHLDRTSQRLQYETAASKSCYEGRKQHIDLRVSLPEAELASNWGCWQYSYICFVAMTIIMPRDFPLEISRRVPGYEIPCL